MDNKLIVKGQPFIANDQLLQEHTIFKLGSKDCTCETAVLIDNIWEDLASTSTHIYLSNEKGNYFYWEVEVSDTASDSNDYITIKYDCPRLSYQRAKEILIGGGKYEFRKPEDTDLIINSKGKAAKKTVGMTEDEIKEMAETEVGLIKRDGYPFKSYITSDKNYLNYWLNQLSNTWTNSQSGTVIQRNEIIFPQTTYINANGDNVTLNKTIVSNNDLGDITNLLSIF